MKFREIGLTYIEDVETGTMIPDIKGPDYKEMTVGARRVMQLQDNDWSGWVNATMISGLGDRIYEEIAERATNSALKTRQDLKHSGMTVWEIESEADKAWLATAQAMLALLREELRTKNFPELRKWQLPPEQ